MSHANGLVRFADGTATEIVTAAIVVQTPTPSPVPADQPRHHVRSRSYCKGSHDPAHNTGHENWSTADECEYLDHIGTYSGIMPKTVTAELRKWQAELLKKYIAVSDRRCYGHINRDLCVAHAKNMLRRVSGIEPVKHVAPPEAGAL